MREQDFGYDRREGDGLVIEGIGAAAPEGAGYA